MTKFEMPSENELQAMTADGLEQAGINAQKSADEMERFLLQITEERHEHQRAILDLSDKAAKARMLVKEYTHAARALDKLAWRKRRG